MSHWRDARRALLCRDAAAEGLDVQFCGALVNYDMPWGLDSDVRAFFALPIPRSVWEDVREFQSPAFREFVESKLTAPVVVRR